MEVKKMKLKTKSKIGLFSPVGEVSDIIIESAKFNATPEQLLDFLTIVFDTYAKILTRVSITEEIKKPKIDDHEIDDILHSMLTHNIVNTYGEANELASVIFKYFKKALVKDIKFMQRTLYLSNKLLDKVWNYTPSACYRTVILVLDVRDVE